MLPQSQQNTCDYYRFLCVSMAHLLKGSRTQKTGKITKQTKNPSKPAVVTKNTEESCPRTATLTKSSIFPNPGSSRGANSPKEETGEYQDDYDDDFDSYDSEIEEESDTESKEPPKPITSPKNDEQKKWDSGNYELREISSNFVPSLSDEGYNEGSGAFKCSNEESGEFKCYNFEKAQIMAQQRLRGTEILSMIKLDKFYGTVFEMGPIPYENFIRLHGTKCTVQKGTQSCDYCSQQSTQTDFNEVENKWVQFPSVFTDFQRYKDEYLGVGGDTVKEISVKTDPLRSVRFLDFFNSSAKIILNLLSTKANKLRINDENGAESSIFGSNSSKTNTELNKTLRDTQILDLYTSKDKNNRLGTIFITIHLTRKEGDVKCGFVVLWDALNMQEPLIILATYGCITCCAENFPDFVFAGSQDGSIIVWNIEEHKSFPKVTSSAFRTGIRAAHEAAVKGIVSGDSSELSGANVNKKVIISLDEEGILIFWGILSKRNNKNVKLVLNFKLNLKNSKDCSLEFSGLLLNHLDSKHLYFLTNSNKILHRLVTGCNTYPKHFTMDDITRVKCMDCCQFSSLYFIAGYENGTIALFSRYSRKPVWIGKSGNAINSVQWSTEKPCIFYAKDDKNVLHMWDLALSDIFPIYSIPFQENIVAMKVSGANSPGQNLFLVIVTSDGQIWVNFLNNEHKPRNRDEYSEDMKYFFNYVNRL